MYAKLHEKGKELVLAACDKELLGKTLKHKGVEFNVSERFYGGMKVTAEELGKMLDECTIANLVGERVINVAKEKKVVREGHILLIGRVPHAQMARMRL